jgi:hypothetical protein
MLSWPRSIMHRRSLSSFLRKISGEDDRSKQSHPQGAPDNAAKHYG